MELTTKQVRLARRWRDNGAPVVRIARRLDVKVEAVERALFNYKPTASLDDVRERPQPDPAAQDDAFVAAMRRAIDRGAERAPIGIDTRPCTDQPKQLRRLPDGSLLGSSAAQCMDM